MWTMTQLQMATVVLAGTIQWRRSETKSFLHSLWEKGLTQGAVWADLFKTLSSMMAVMTTH